jgi:hypothetical protein
MSEQDGTGELKADRSVKTPRAMAFLVERSRQTDSGEWLGAESHVPNLSSQLRRRDRRGLEPALPWLAAGVFAAGFVMGSLAALLLSRSHKSD